METTDKLERNVVPPSMIGMAGVGPKLCGPFGSVQSGLAPFRYATVSRKLTYSSVAGPPALYYLTAPVDAAAITAFDAGETDAETNPNLTQLTSPDSLLKFSDTNAEKEGELSGEETLFKGYALELYAGHPYIVSGGKRRGSTKFDAFLDSIKAAVLEFTKVSLLVGNAGTEYQLGNPLLWPSTFGMNGSYGATRSGQSPVGFYRTLLQPASGGSFRSKDKLALKWTNEREFSIESSTDVTGDAYVDIKAVIIGLPVDR